MQPNYPTQPQYPVAPAQPMPQYPTQPVYPQQGYAPAPAPAYPQQPQFPQQYAPAPAYPTAPTAPPPPAGTLDGFFDQPSTGGGPSFKFVDANRVPQIGKTYVGIVARTVTNADIRHQTNSAGVAQTYKDGRPKLVMIVPMLVQPSPEFPDGQAGWWVKGQARDELARAMSEAGAPAGPPEAGAAVSVTLTGTRPVPGMNPQFLYRVQYARPNGAAPAATPQPVAQIAPVVQQQVPVQTAPVMSTATGQPVMHQQQTPAQPIPQQVPVPAQAQPVAEQAPTAAPAGFNADQAALFAKLTGGQQAA